VIINGLRVIFGFFIAAPVWIFLLNPSDIKVLLKKHT
jgi:hypothetical protein